LLSWKDPREKILPKAEVIITKAEGVITQQVVALEDQVGLFRLGRDVLRRNRFSVPVKEEIAGSRRRESFRVSRTLCTHDPLLANPRVDFLLRNWGKVL